MRPTDSIHHVLNLGAGIQSTALALMSHRGENGIPRFTAAIFADVGDEPSSVYRHLEWLTKEVSPSFPVLVRRRSRTLGQSLILGTNATGQRFASIPAFTSKTEGEAGGMLRRQCTKEFKVEVVERAIRMDILGLKPRQRWPKSAQVYQYFGLSFDEGIRVFRVKNRMLTDGHSTPRFPLWDLQATRKDCFRYLERYGIPHQVHRSACVFCPFKSNEEWRHLRDTDPEGWKHAVEIDRAIREKESLCAQSLTDKLYLHRQCVPLDRAAIDTPERAADQYQFGFVNDCEGMCGQ